jgi:hypothetical protein
VGSPISRYPERVEVLRPRPASGALWQPLVGKETVDLIRTLDLPDESRQRVVEEAAKVLSRCVPPSAAGGRETGLVIGYVQSGKTMSFTTVGALARDNGYQLVVVITGVSVPLLNQSTDRLIKDLRLSTRKDRKWQRFTNPTPDGNDVTNLQNTLADWDDATVHPDERRTVLITVMKNVKHLDNLIAVLEALSLDRRPAIVIDDEADQAGLNTGVRQGRESATYQRLLRIRRALPHHTYLQYTATPQAPLLINLIDVLSPRFTELLTPGPDYVGGRDFFIEAPGLVRTVPESEIPSASNTLHEPPDSLLQALRLFFLGVAAGLIRDQGHGNRSMLVHPSQRTYDHGQYFTWVRAVTERWGATLGLPEGDSDRSELLDEFRDAFNDLQATVADLPTFEELIRRLPRAIRQCRVEEVNTRGGETPAIEWNATYPHILVGGQAMDRGFTVEGLTVTYMPRGIGVGNADNVQQRARFLGYKRQYLGYCRVFLENIARDAYRSYVVHEEDVRARLAAYSATGKPLSEWKREFFLTSQLKPTRKSVLGLDYMRVAFSDEWWNPGVPHDTMEAVEKNREVVSSFVRSLRLSPDKGHADRSEVMRHLVDDDVSLESAFEDLLTRYIVTAPEDSQRFTALLILIRTYLEDNPEATCRVYVMSGGKLRKRGLDEQGRIANLFQGAHPDTRGAIYPGDRKLVRQGALTIQIHQLVIEDEQGGSITGVPTLAVWVPREIAHDLVVQDQPKPD